MTFTRTGIGLDGWTPYAISGYEAKTIVEFISEALFLSVGKRGSFIIMGEELKYENGELVDEIPEEWYGVEFAHVEAWGFLDTMDYYIKTK